MISPTKDHAYQFALMLMTGVPAVDALQYFLPEGAEVDATSLGQWAKLWQRHKLVMEQMVLLQKGDWTELTPTARIKMVLDKTYNEMAYCLYTHNYAAETNPNVLAKLDKCRLALEAKVAGVAGQLSPLDQFFKDINDGKLLSVPKAPKVEVNIGPTH